MPVVSFTYASHGELRPWLALGHPLALDDQTKFALLIYIFSLRAAYLLIH